MGNLLWITDLIYSGKLFSILFVQTLYSTHCLLLHDKLSLIIERNQPQQFDQGCSHLTLHVNVLTVRKKKKKSPLSVLWPILARWRRKAEKRFVPYGILVILLQEKGLVVAELCCFSLGKEKITKQKPTKFFIHVCFFVRTSKLHFVNHM